MKTWLKGGVSLLTALVLSTQAQAISLENAVRIAIETYPEIKERQAINEASEHNVNESYGRYLPTVDLEAGFGPEYTNSPTTRSRTSYTLDGGDKGSLKNRKELSLTITETLFDGFDREAEIARREAIQISNELTTLDVAELLALDVVRAYVDIARYEEIHALATDNLKRHEEILEDVRNRVDGGQAGISDLHQAVAREANARARMAVTKRSLDQARILFERVVGQAADEVERPDFDPALLPEDVESAIEEANKTSPLLQSIQADVKAAEHGVDTAKSDFYPTFELEVAGTANSDIDGTDGLNQDLTAMVKMNYNLYRGGADLNRSRSAKSRHSESRATLARQTLEIKEDISQSWSEMIRREEEAMARSDQVVANSQVVATYSQEFQIGQRDLLDVLDSENELFNAQSSMLSAEYEALYSRYRIMAVMGKLLDHVQVKVPMKVVQVEE
jgi:adhesin transport system outer membrane protein